MIWTYKNIALTYIPFILLFAWIGISYDEITAKGFCVALVFGVVVCMVMEANARRLKKLC